MKKQIGFTITELMIVMVIAAILLTQAVPSFREFLKNNRLTATTNEFIAATNLARSEAIKRGRNATMCVSSDSMTPVPTCTGGNDWTVGWLVWVDTNSNGLHENGEELRAYESQAAAGLTLTSNGPSQFRYDATGAVDTQLNIEVCDDRANETGRRIFVTATGRIETERDFPGC